MTSPFNDIQTRDERLRGTPTEMDRYFWEDFVPFGLVLACIVIVVFALGFLSGFDYAEKRSPLFSPGQSGKTAVQASDSN